MQYRQNRINTKDYNMALQIRKAGLHAETLRFGYLRTRIKTHVTICLSECKLIAANDSDYYLMKYKVYPNI